jgi:uncharacterized protein
MYSTILLGIIFFGNKAEAAWPDSSPGRVYSIDLFRKDLQTPGGLDEDTRLKEYKKACSLKYFPSCKYETWTDKDGNTDLQAAGKFFASRCKSEPLSCVVSGWAKGFVNGVPSNEAPNPKKAFQDLTYGCKKKAYGPACAHLGEMYFWGVGTNKDPKKAQALFQEACKARDSYGCYIEGDLYFYGEGAEKDPRKAIELYNTGCDKGYTQACVKLGLMYKKGDSVAQDYAKAINHFERSCTEKGVDKNWDGCFHLAEMYNKGQGIENSASLAMGLYGQLKKANDPRGFYGMASLYQTGRVVAKDLDISSEMYDNSCTGGYAPACSKLGSMLINNSEIPNIPRGIKYVQMGCDKGDIEGCVQLGVLYYKGKGVKQDFGKAKGLFENACDANRGIGCYSLGTMFDKGQGVKSDKKKAFKLFEKGCSLLDGASCGAVGQRWLDGGGGVMKNTKEAVLHFELGCDHGHQSSCQKMADFYYAGKVIEKDVPRALNLYKQSCTVSDSKVALLGCKKAGDILLNESGDKPNYGEAFRMYDRACKADVQEACDAAQPIMFYGKYERILQDSFKSNKCEVITFHENNPELNNVVINVNKDKFSVIDGKYKGQTFVATLSDTKYPKDEFVHKAQSFWKVQSDQSQIKDVEHHENWYYTRKTVQDFPGDESFSLDPKVFGVEQVSAYYSRSNQTVSRDKGLSKGKKKSCHYINDVTTLMTEHCSEVQALIASRILTVCD